MAPQLPCNAPWHPLATEQDPKTDAELGIMEAAKGNRRPPIKRKVAEDVIAECRRVCAMCFALQGDGTTKNGQLAHLDQNNANNNPDNLAWLCLAHHDDYDTVRRQTRNFTPGEVKRYQADLLAAIESGIVPVSYNTRGASLRLSCTVGLVQGTKFKRTKCGAEIYLAARVSNTGSTPTGIEIARFSWKGEIIADEHWGIPLGIFKNGKRARPDEDQFPEYARYLTCSPKQMVEPGRTHLFVIPLSVKESAPIMEVLTLVLAGGPEEHHLDPPALLELVPVIGAPVASVVKKLCKPLVR